MFNNKVAGCCVGRWLKERQSHLFSHYVTGEFNARAQEEGRRGIFTALMRERRDTETGNAADANDPGS